MLTLGDSQDSATGLINIFIKYSFNKNCCLVVIFFKFGIICLNKKWQNFEIYIIPENNILKIIKKNFQEFENNLILLFNEISSFICNYYRKNYDKKWLKFTLSKR